MMEHMEKVEKLREKTNITYEEAKAVLEECDWDLLDAVVKLESRGKIREKSTASFSTEGAPEEDAPKSPQQLVESYQSYQQDRQKKEKGIFHSLWNGIKYLLRKGCENRFIVRRHGVQLMEIPVLLLVILMIAFFWILLILMFIGLFCGYSYSFAGPDLGRKDINSVMDKASKAAEDFKADLSEQEDE